MSQEAYATENHFEHRRRFEEKDGCVITEENSKVEIKFDGDLVIYVGRCTQCDELMSGDKIDFSNKTEYNTTDNTPWLCPRTL